MTETKPGKPSLLAKVKLPQAFAVSTAGELTRGYVMDEKMRFPFVFEAAAEIDPAHWIERRRETVERLLLEHGAVLLRGFDAKNTDAFAATIGKFGSALPYTERSSPRTRVAGNIYTSTEYPADQEIFFHNENSYAHRFPRRLFFYCRVEPRRGGATPLSDARRVLNYIPSGTIEKFNRKGVLYVRNFGHGVGLSWREVFQTDDREKVEEICRAGGYLTEWLGGDRLRTKRVGPAILKHPETNEPVWFNHAAFFHVTTHAPAVRDALLAQFAPEDLPHNTFYGDGEPFEPETPDILRDAYRRASASFAWRAGDVLMIDNILTAHARAPFEGARKILVAMTD